MTALLAFDTSDEVASVALRLDERLWSRESEGGARASATLLPTVQALMREAGIGFAALDAIAFGRGPGAFTGLRTACAVAQGLAFGAGKPVVAVDSLLAVAESARRGDAAQRIWAVTDARMDQLYAAEYDWRHGRWHRLVAPFLSAPEALAARWSKQPPDIVAGNGLVAFADRLPSGDARREPAAAARAVAVLAVAEQAWRDGEAIDAAAALPLYVRDKVAETTQERAAARSRAARGAAT